MFYVTRKRFRIKRMGGQVLQVRLPVLGATRCHRFPANRQGLLIVPRNSSGKLSAALSDYPNPGGLGDESPNVAPVPEN